MNCYTFCAVVNQCFFLCRVFGFLFGLASFVFGGANLFCYLFLGYPLEYRLHFFSAYIMPFHDYFCGWVLSGGSMLCVAVFAHKSAPLQ